MVGTPRVVTSEDVAAYTGMVEAHAARYARIREMENDYDDFVQEGYLAVFQALQKGEHPSNEVVCGRMSNWTRTRRRQLHFEAPLIEELDGAAA